MFKFRHYLLFGILTALTLGAFIHVAIADAALQLLRSADFGTVYYVDNDNVRHPFPNAATYQSWYGDDFSAVVTVSNQLLSQFSLGKNITVRPGTSLVKVRTDPKVYAVEIGGVLRPIDSEEIAEQMYGEDWAERVIDIPDVFFGDYTVGQIVDDEREIAEGSVLKRPGSDKVFYLERNILQPFSSEQAVADNGYLRHHIITTDKNYYIRTREITEFDATIFNPVARPVQTTYDCAAKNLRAAVILLTTGEPNPDDIDKVQQIKLELANRFNWASFELATLDLSYPTLVVPNDGELLKRRNDGTYEILNETINSFYEQNSDQFDFIYIWTDFDVPQVEINEIAHYIRVTNRQNGLGLGRHRRGEIYGSGGKLKGLAMMGPIDQYDTSTTSGMDQALNIALHEILHQWGAGVTFIDEQGESNKALLRESDFGHWSWYAGFISPLGGSGWQDNGDGTFTSLLSQMSRPNLRQFSPLDLYLMGLIPAQLTDPVPYIEPANPGVKGNTIAGTVAFVSIDQIISDIGKVSCQKD